MDMETTLKVMNATIAGIPCKVRVINYTPERQAQLYGPPENCYPAESAEIEFEVYDRTGYPAKWLEAKMKQADVDRIMTEYESTLEEN
jgi:hypothetical protein